MGWIERLIERNRACTEEMQDHTRRCQMIFLGIFKGTYIDRVYVPFVEAAHVSIWKKPVGEQRQQNKFGQCQQLISGKSKSCTPEID